MGSNIEAVRRQILLVKQATISPEAFAKRHAQVARQEIVRLESEQGKYPRQTFVDGRRGVQEESVKPGGVIEYQISPANDVVDDVYAALAALAPIKNPAKKRGHPSRWYLDHIWVFVNGQRVTAAGDAVNIGPADIVVFVDVAPYARKIEYGLSKKFAPNGVFELTARKMARKWANVLRITFDYRNVSGVPAFENFAPKGPIQYPSIEIGPW